MAVVGGAGYVGSILTERLLEEGASVLVLDTFWFGDFLKEHPRLSSERVDSRHVCPEHLEGIDAVIHLAAIANDPLTDLNPNVSWEIATLGTLRVLNSAKAAGVKQLIFASSGSVYGVATAPIVTEESELVPLSLYNKTKMIAERIVQSFDGFDDCFIVRPGTVCGFSPRMRLDLTVNALTFSALSRGLISVDGGIQVRPHIHIEDLCQVYLHLLTSGARSGIYNAGFENLSVSEVARLVQTVVDSNIDFSGKLDPRDYRLSSKKILSTGFSPSKSVKDAIEDLKVAWSTGNLVDRPEWHSTSHLGEVLNRA